MDSSVVSFGDSIVRESDLKALEDGEWLTDRVISFALEYLYEETLNDLDKKKISFVNAAVCQLIKLSDEVDAMRFLGELSLIGKEHIILVVSDHNDPSRSGGTHWSLLICRQHLKPNFLIVDSIQATKSVNQESTSKLMRILTKFFGLQTVDSCIEEATKQLNSMDCGMFVIEFTRLYIESVKRNDSTVDFTQLDPKEVMEQRQVWANLIRTLAAEHSDSVS